MRARRLAGRAAPPSEKTARPHIVSQVRQEGKWGGRTIIRSNQARGVSRAALRCSCSGVRPARAGCRGTARFVTWYRSLYAPRTGGAHDSHHRTAGIAGRTRRRGGGVAARRARSSLSGHGASVCSSIWLLTIRKGTLVLPRSHRGCRKQGGLMTSPRSSRPLTARALRCCFRLRRRSDPREPQSLLQPHQPHRFLIIARRLWDRNVYSCIDGVHRLHRRFSDAGASVDKVHNPAVSSKCQKTPRIFHFIVPTFGFSRQRETRV